jgi:2-polyprenyl-3-methyl-5-hydroxy-6-metoxy-1,4-benzoquinol methylase
MAEDSRAQASARLRRMAQESIANGDLTGLFDAIYRSADGNAGTIPWARLRPNQMLIEWLEQQHLDGVGKRALVVGCGLGDDAEALAHRGFDVTAFDISPEAIQWCQRRFPESSVQYAVNNLLALPDAWSGRFDFIMEAYTLQSLPEQTLRMQAAAQLARCLAPTGSLLVICFGREPEEEQTSLPWPLSWEDLAIFQQFGLREVSFERLTNGESEVRFRVHFAQPSAP